MTNFDTAELGKFNRLAEQWWNTEGDFKTLHEINPLRLNYIVQHSGSLRGRKVIDVGCGGGILSESLAREGALVTALDLAEDVLEAAKSHARQQQLEIDYRLVSVEQLAAERAGQFDVVSCMEMLEHVPDPAAIVAACTRLCKPGGHVFFSTINRSAKAFFLAIVGAEYLLQLLPRGTHEYAKLIRPAELAAWSRASGLDIRDISGMHYNPFNGRHALTDNPDINYLMYCRNSNE